MIEVRFSQSKDMQQLKELNNSLWNDTNAPVPIHYDSVEEYENLRPPGSQMVAIDGDIVCGYVIIKPVFPIPSNEHVSEMAIGVRDDYQGKGVGRKLVEAAEQWARDLGKKKITLRVMETNPNAIAFYKRLGYIEQARLIKEFNINGNFVDDIFMYKWLDN